MADAAKGKGYGVDQLMPALCAQRLFGLQTNRIALPDTGDVHVRSAVVQIDAVALAFRGIGHSADHGAMRRSIRIDPGGNGKTILDVKISHRARVEVGLPIENAGVFDSPSLA